MRKIVENKAESKDMDRTRKRQSGDLRTTLQAFVIALMRK